MNKRYLSVLAVIFALCIALVGCGGGSGSTDTADTATEATETTEAEPQEEPDYAAFFVGDWEFAYMTADDPDDAIDAATVQELKDAGYVATLTMSADGTFSISFFDDDDMMTGTWEATGEHKATISIDDSAQVSKITYDDSTQELALAESNDVLYFVRSDGTSSSSGSGKLDGGSSQASDGDVLDSNGNPTAFGILELDGADLVAALEGEGFEWEDDSKWWVSSDGNDCFYVSGNNDYEYIRSEISAFGVNAKGDSCVFIVVVDDRDYSSAKDAFDKLCKAGVEVRGLAWLDDTTAIAIVESPSGNANFVLLTYTEDPGLYIVDFFNERAISSGLLEEYLGDNYGTTIDELLENLF